MNLKAMSAAALFMSAAAVGGMGMSASARAADLGGNCCADLEERVAELEATTAKKGNRKVSLEVSGFVTTALMYYDNGAKHDLLEGDNSNAPSRIDFKGSAKISPNVTAGFAIELAVTSAGLGSVTVTDDDGGQAGDGSVTLRLGNWWIEHSKLGRVTVGRINAALDSIAEMDLVGTNIASLEGMNIGNGIAISGSGLGAASKWGDIAQAFDGDRDNGIRYDTPTVGGFMLSASFSENDRSEIALRYAGEFAGFRLAAGVGYGRDSDPASDFAYTSLSGNSLATFDHVDFTAGSFSLLHVNSGLFLSAFGGSRQFDFDTPGSDYTASQWGLRTGISKNWFGIGNTVLWYEFNNFNNVNNLGFDTNQWGLGVLQNIDAAAMELFLTYKSYSLDTHGPGHADDFDMVFSGARIKF